MNLKEAEQAGRLAREVRDIDGEIEWLTAQDNAEFPSQRIARGSFVETGVLPSAEVARAIRALLRRDFAQARIGLVEKLEAMGVAVKSH